MLIRSQNRKMLVNIANVDCLGIIELSPERFDVSAYNRDGNTTLGIYSTQEKAMKVLDMIEKKYVDVFYVFGNDATHVYNIPKAFQMPADEEVEEE